MDNTVPTTRALLDLAKDIIAKDKQLQLQGVQIGELSVTVGKIADLALNIGGVPGGTESEFDIFWFYDLFNAYVYGECEFDGFIKAFEFQLKECIRIQVNSGQIVGG